MKRWSGPVALVAAATAVVAFAAAGSIPAPWGLATVAAAGLVALVAGVAGRKSGWAAALGMVIGAAVIVLLLVVLAWAGWRS